MRCACGMQVGKERGGFACAVASAYERSLLGGSREGGCRLGLGTWGGGSMVGWLGWLVEWAIDLAL